MIVVAGESLIDIVPGTDGALRPLPGGGPFNAARTIARLEQPVAYLGRISTDAFGRDIERLLWADGVRLETAVHTDDPTTLAIAEVDPDGAATYRFYSGGTAAPGLTREMAFTALDSLDDDVRIIFVGTLGLALDPIGTALEALVNRIPTRTLVAVDPNCRPGAVSDQAAYRARLMRVLARADVVKASEDDLRWLAPDVDPAAFAASLLEARPAVVLLTRGSAGALALVPGGTVELVAPPVTVVDTIGAGDAFAGAFLAWWSRHGYGRNELADAGEVERAAEFACLVAAKTCEHAGALPPRLADLHPSP